VQQKLKAASADAAFFVASVAESKIAELLAEGISDRSSDAENIG
jgi:hypothetical protein